MEKLTLNLEKNYTLSYKRKVLENNIIDRKSKYTTVWWYVAKKEEIKPFIKELLKDSYFRKATHNTYSYRILLESWSVLEWKNDDWETGAWNCVLRELQRENMVNTIVVVTALIPPFKVVVASPDTVPPHWPRMAFAYALPYPWESFSLDFAVGSGKFP